MSRTRIFGMMLLASVSLFAQAAPIETQYGDSQKQTYTVYPTDGKKPAPAIIMVHGGAWMFGDKSAKGVVEDKARRWNPQGIAVVSVNYRLVPEAGPHEQAKDIARAINDIRRRASEFGIDGRHVVLMGHSAGAHLVSLVSADTNSFGIAPVDGTVSLDSAALDLTTLLNNRHLRLYDKAFQNENIADDDPNIVLSSGASPYLAICSSKREISCAQAYTFADTARRMGVSVTVREADMRHGEISTNIGTTDILTGDIEGFISDLNIIWKQRLQ